MSVMNIGQASEVSGVSAKMIRHYESVGLLPQARRTDSGYRQYAEKDAHTLRFVRNSRDLGFSLDQIREFLDLWHNRRRRSSQVKALAEAHVKQLDQKVRELLAMKATLEKLVHSCHGDDRPDCPILGGLETGISSSGDAPAQKAASPGVRRIPAASRGLAGLGPASSKAHAAR